MLYCYIIYEDIYVIKKYRIFLHHTNVNISANILSPLQWDQVASFVLHEVFSAVANQNYQKSAAEHQIC